VTEGVLIGLQRDGTKSPSRERSGSSKLNGLLLGATVIAGNCFCAYWFIARLPVGDFVGSLFLLYC